MRLSNRLCKNFEKTLWLGFSHGPGEIFKMFHKSWTMKNFKTLTITKFLKFFLWARGNPKYKCGTESKSAWKAIFSLDFLKFIYRWISEIQEPLRRAKQFEKKNWKISSSEVIKGHLRLSIKQKIWAKSFVVIES